MKRATVPPSVGDLVITEVMPKPKLLSAAAAQWFEVMALTDLDLNGVGLDRATDANVKPEIIAAPECIHLAAGSYAVFARSQDAALNGNVSALAAFSFSLNPNAAPEVRVVYGTDVIDSATWVDAKPGVALQLEPNASDGAANDDPSKFCSATTIYDATTGNLGTPGTANPPCPPVIAPGACLDGQVARPIVKPATGQLVITEFLANARGTGNDSTQEWFEIANAGQTAFDVNGITFSGTTASDTIETANCQTVAPGSFALFAHSSDAAVNGGLPAVDATFSFALANSNGSISALDGPTLLDQVTWTVPSQGDGISRQLEPTHLNGVANDDEHNFCTAIPAQQYGSRANFGTPKAANQCR